MQASEEMIKNARERIIYALDVSGSVAAMPTIKTIAPLVGIIKTGLELITSGEAPEVIKAIQGMGGQVFYDGKFDDIPNTVGRATKIAAGFGVKMINVHASAGKESIKAAIANKGKSLILGVTILTSIDETECKSIFGDTPGNKVVQFAEMLVDLGADGIICSPKELVLLGKIEKFNHLLKITPGVRPVWAETGDQKRVMTPADAIKAGATHLVIGRPISSPPKEIGSPTNAAYLIAKEIAEAMA
ncbi:MAG: orotidine-5'-phosphate decarboxylase [Candidatus Nealsonbacteria bacterium DGGOD1a]|nr:MAG: orotidine-5'-phosphate decarboxylase [Candidatus Nealsonbacteria bacterium DGGOD1a]